MAAEMSVSVHLWVLAVIVVGSMLAGFRLGLGGWEPAKEERETGEDRNPEEETAFPEARDAGGSRGRQGAERVRAGGSARRDPLGRKKKPDKEPAGLAMGSPAQGEVSPLREDGAKGVKIRAEQGKLYSPASGKIIRLYPAGNAFRLRTEDGIELTVRAGVRTEELEGRYFRPRVLQNEVVGKGKLLLEFDKEGIEAEGYDTSVWIMVDGAEGYRKVTFAEEGQIRTGENLLWVSK
ncbi:MAG: PTS glucose transporter subunit IIA [Clostridium sp.]|jgi:phosphotransferase system IIA component|nr:PTS glucose transporter subunit IIA [Clostridium sp.]